MEENRGIGKDGSMPWKVKKDMDFFKTTTKGSAIIMGRKTWESLFVKPLKNRDNFVVSKQFEGEKEGAIWSVTFEDAYKKAMLLNKNIFMIGGAKLLKQALLHPMLKYFYLTQLKASFECDVFLEPFEPSFILEEVLEQGVDENSSVEYQILKYKHRKYKEV